MGKCSLGRNSAGPAMSGFACAWGRDHVRLFSFPLPGQGQAQCRCLNWPKNGMEGSEHCTGLERDPPPLLSLPCCLWKRLTPTGSVSYPSVSVAPRGAQSMGGTGGRWGGRRREKLGLLSPPWLLWVETSVSAAPPLWFQLLRADPMCPLAMLPFSVPTAWGWC